MNLLSEIELEIWFFYVTWDYIIIEAEKASET